MSYVEQSRGQDCCEVAFLKFVACLLSSCCHCLQDRLEIYFIDVSASRDQDVSTALVSLCQQSMAGNELFHEMRTIIHDIVPWRKAESHVCGAGVQMKTVQLLTVLLIGTMVIVSGKCVFKPQTLARAIEQNVFCDIL